MNIVVLNTGISGNVFEIRGYEPSTNRPVSYHDIHGLYVLIRDSTEIGDTLVKKLTETSFLLKKKRYNLIFELNCDGPNYLPTKPFREQK